MRLKITFTLVTFCLIAVTASGETLPIDVFTSGPKIIGPTISPDGSYIAAIAEVGGVRVAMVLDVKRRSPFNVVMTSDESANVVLSWCDWANATRLVCGMKGHTSNFKYVSKLVAIDADGSHFKDLGNVYSGDKVIDWTDDEPQSILVESAKSIGELNVYTGGYKDRTRQLIATRLDNKKITNFFTDGAGNLPLAYGRKNDRGIFYILDNDREWQPLKHSPVNASFEDDLQPLRVIAGQKLAYALGIHDGRNALWSIDLEDKQPPQVVFSHQRVDVFGPIMVRNSFVGVSYFTDRPAVHFVDRNVEAQMSKVDKTLTGTFNLIQSWTSDRKQWIVSANSDVDGATYYLYSADSSNLSLLGKSYPLLKPSKLSRTRNIEFSAEDGTVVSALLTEPSGLQDKPRPLIVIVQSIGELPLVGSYDATAQFLSSRGYAVLRVSFRGSRGHGRGWIKAANFDWGNLPYTDSRDGARWAIQKGFADPKRTCIMGEKWGGYTALVGAAHDDLVFTCAVSIDSSGDLSDLVYRLPRGQPFTSDHLEFPAIDALALRKNAPLWNAEKIHARVLLMYFSMPGMRDVEMPAMSKALRREKKPFKEVVIGIKNYVHPSEKERVQVLESLEQFFATQFGS